MISRNLIDLPFAQIANTQELQTFQDEVCNVAQKYSDITGVLAVGSLIYGEIDETYFNSRVGKMGEAYDLIRNPMRRRQTFSRNSDLDLWIMTRDNQISARAKSRVELAGTALLEELSTDLSIYGTPNWRSNKISAFSEFYKQPDLYSQHFNYINSGAPWNAESFKTDLENALIFAIPDLVSRLPNHFDKTLPGSFLEVRAFPESLFNLRPNDIKMSGGVEDRAPFPRIADAQWISPEHSSFVLYKTDDAEIYPFCENGEVLGKSTGDYIEREAAHEKDKKHFGGLLLKPDAMQSDQIVEIQEIINRETQKVGAKIVADITRELTPEEISQIYPFLNDEDLCDVEKYLTSGKCRAIIFEFPLNKTETLRTTNKMKGVRIGDRSLERLFEGRILNGGIRDLLPLPKDEAKYRALIPTILRRQNDSSVKFSPEEYRYYAHNLAHSPDNGIEMMRFLQVFAPQFLEYNNN